METQDIKQFSEARKERARQILDKSEPEVIDENTFLVPSQNSNRKYKVTFYDTYSCDCLDFQERLDKNDKEFSIESNPED